MILVVLVAVFFGVDRLMKKFFLRKAWADPNHHLSVYSPDYPIP